MKNNIKHIVLTGGVGSRLWPLSRKSKPKQYLEIFGDSSLFELTINRSQQFADSLVVVGNQSNVHLTESALKKLGIESCEVITETRARNTAPAIAFAALAANSEEVLLVTPSDHIITQNEEYTIAVQRAIELAQKGYLVTFGVTPTYPETGYGYIEYNNEDVISFREKPNGETAKQFLKQGNFLWNSGMFCFKAKTYLDELKAFAPTVYETVCTAWNNLKDGIVPADWSEKIPSISIDYAVMERSKKIKVVNSNIEWSDMGSFEALYDFLRKDNHPVDENNNMIIGTYKHTSFVGVKDTIFIHTHDANLILQRESAQQVKDTYEKLEKEQPELIY